MIEIAKYRDEEVIVIGLLLLSGFLFLNVRQDVGTISAILTTPYLIAVMSRRREWFVEYIRGGFRDVKWSSTLIIASVLLVLWLIIASQVLSSTTGQSVLPFNVFSKVHAQTNLPTLTQDKNIQLIAFGFVIPFVETPQFLSTALLFWSTIMGLSFLGTNVKGIPKDIKVWWVILLVGVTASMYHWQARLYSDIVIVLDVLFWAMSAYMVFVMKQLLPLAIFHVFLNSGVLLFG